MSAIPFDGSAAAGSPLFDDRAAPVWSQPQREAHFWRWFDSIAAQHALDRTSLEVASADASHRRYFRVGSASGSRIIMDAPPERENCQPFVAVAQLVLQAGLKGPQVLAWDQGNGFMLLSDLGRQTMLQALQQDEGTAHGLYLEATKILVQWQCASKAGVLAPYDEPLLRRELELFAQWYLGQYRELGADREARLVLDEAFACIVAQNLAWPNVFVHRDFMPRNLMVGPGGARQVEQESLGVIDFQDAVFGPITYDIACLLRDAFVSWEEEFCLDITIRYWENARRAGLPVGQDFGDFYRGVEWMGVQRHLKVAGIFARLTLRDGKPQYLADAPRFIAYLRASCARYRELKPLLRLIDRVEGLHESGGFAFGRF
jgi:aminoglycoside/choline kinase family phosphotransferase